MFGAQHSTAQHSTAQSGLEEINCVGGKAPLHQGVDDCCILAFCKNTTYIPIVNVLFFFSKWICLLLFKYFKNKYVFLIPNHVVVFKFEVTLFNM